MNTIIIVVLFVLSIGIYFISSSNSGESNDTSSEELNNLAQESNQNQLAEENGDESSRDEAEVLSAVDESNENQEQNESSPELEVSETSEREVTPTPSPTSTKKEESANITDAGSEVKEVAINYGLDPDTYENKTAVFFFLRNTSRSDIGDFVLEELLKGPTKEQIDQFNVFTPISLAGESNCEGKDFQVSQKGTKVTIRFCKKINLINKSDGSIARNVIIANFKQFDSVDSVEVFRSDGSILR